MCKINCSGGSDGDLCDVCYWRKRAEQLVAANKRIRELEERCVDYARTKGQIHGMYDAEREALLAEQVLSDKLEKALCNVLEAGNEGDWQSARQETISALAEVAAIRSGKQHE